MWYNIKFKDNLIDIKNLSFTESLYVTISITETCDDSIFETIINRQEVNSEQQFRLPQRDGLYKILLEQAVTTTETSEFTYPYYGNLLEAIIDETEYFLCNCDCIDCSDECNKDEKTYLSLMLKAFSYYTLLYRYYPRFYDAVFKCLNCSILDISKCVLLNEKVTGDTDNNQLFKKIISSMYTSFYYAEYYNTADKEYINNKFKYDKIKKCILVTNTDIECITNQIENNMGIFQVVFDNYVNLPPSEVGDYSTTAGNRAVLTVTPAMLTTLTVPVYQDPENNPAQAMRVDSLATNGAILKLGANPVTIGQIILISTIATNALTLSGPDADALTTSTFNFSIRDTGSMQFVS